MEGCGGRQMPWKGCLNLTYCTVRRGRAIVLVTGPPHTHPTLHASRHAPRFTLWGDAPRLTPRTSHAARPTLLARAASQVGSAPPEISTKPRVFRINTPLRAFTIKVPWPPRPPPEAYTDHTALLTRLF